MPIKVGKVIEFKLQKFETWGKVEKRKFRFGFNFNWVPITNEKFEYAWRTIGPEDHMKG